MGLFGKKKQVKQKRDAPSSSTVAKKAIAATFDEEYKKELKRLGRHYFAEVIEADRDMLRREMQRTFTETSNDLRVYIRRQFGASVEYVRQELSHSIADQMTEHRRLLDEARENAQQTLTRSEQEFQLRFGELSHTMEQSITEQQSRMEAVFEKNERQLQVIRDSQNTTIERLDKAAAAAERQSENFTAKLSELTKRHDGELTAILQRQQQELREVTTAQKTALQKIEHSADEIEKQYADFGATIDGAVAKQQERMIKTFDENFARVVEQYILDALGDQFDVRDQLPSIMKRLEEDKPSIVEDVKL